MDFSVIDTAGLTQAQFGELVGVSRVTVNTWVKGRFHPRLGLRDRVARALILIHEATEAGNLPIADTSFTAAVKAQLKAIAAALNAPRK